MSSLPDVASIGPAAGADSQLPWRSWPPRLWRAMLVMWLLFWLVLTFVAVQDNWRDDGIRWWQPLVWEGTSALFGTLTVYWLLRYGSRQQHLLATPWRWFWQQLKWLPLISALFVVIVFNLRAGIYVLLGTRYTHGPWLQVYFYETAKMALFLGLWLGVIFGIHSFLAWREQQIRLHAMQRALTEAKLQQLKAQLQPHFLFNTLNTISAFMHTDVAKADRLLTQLADLLRASLTLGERDRVTLADELQMLRLYADIMTERFAPRVQLHWQISDDTLALPVPALLLQPLLENAFKHGVERHSAPTEIVVRCERQAEKLLLIVSNRNAAPDASNAGQLPGTGVGLRNCRERLQAMYGEQAALQAEASANAFVVRVTLPILSSTSAGEPA